MSDKPILVLQTRRLGDLILSFPLLAALKIRYPNNPAWVVAEPQFFQGLKEFAPSATFFPVASLPGLARESYEAVINLSGGLPAAKCAASADTPLRLGALAKDGTLRIAGFWQLYRAALTQNNRHNAFHWSDLNMLDLDLPGLPHAHPMPRPAGGNRVGLFLGASEPEKRPDAHFWIGLARRLANAGLKPILLGGHAEQALGAEVSAKTGPLLANFCGKTNLTQLAALLRGLDLLITPDTGPMHFADWLGVPVLNLSMGNVHARETGPVGNGQWVVRANMSCVGCWRCARGRLYCRQPFTPRAIATVSLKILGRSEAPFPPALDIQRVCRDATGLHAFEAIATNQHSCRPYLENFWRSAFLHFHKPASGQQLALAAADLAAHSPGLTAHLRKNIGKMLATFSAGIRGGHSLPRDFWKNQPWHSRLFAGHTQMFLQNEDFSRKALEIALERMARLEALFAGLT